MRPIILASTSPYRKALLARLRIPFQVSDPAFEEIPLPGETPEQRVARFADGKAAAVARNPDLGPADALVIGSDQILLLDGKILGKPATHRRAVEQLSHCSGRRVRFLTAVVLIDRASMAVQRSTEAYEVQFRTLSLREIEHYLKVDMPYDCAGSFRAEGLGIALFSAMAGSDPTSLIGLPLIALSEMLRRRGVEPLLVAAPLPGSEGT